MKRRSVTEICSDIQSKRNKMLKFAKMYGMNHEYTLSASQELDYVILEYLLAKHPLEKDGKGLESQLDIVDDRQLDMLSGV
ncbi:aspartyl-phosphate phosphatase Spo0E family protein [Bacillus massiliglaciei]|uniref:aspartyl-phosphate phosphatase Spo0E family protein n=1 Tax=Bacillus massiliglaciei TaxID=1816693 RepID=UPI000DA622F4|nr:aspartyl-phosphate phosphatase Spo0E family protein [Bacillus massiliglaciei]